MAEPRFCVVCGTGSHREDWQGVANPACDSHSKEEVAEAVRAKGKGGTPTPPVEVPSDPNPVTVPSDKPDKPEKDKPEKPEKPDKHSFR